MHSLRAVFLSPIAPARSGNGLAMRMGVFAEALSRIARLDVIVVPVAGDIGNAEPFAREIGVGLHRVEIADRVDTHFALLSRIRDEQTRLEAFRAYAEPSFSRGLSAPVLHDIAQLVDAFRPDLVHVGRSYLLPCLEALSSRVAVTLDLDEDDRASFTSQALLLRAEGDATQSDWLEQEGIACDRLIGQYHKRFRHVFVASRSEAMALSRRHAGLDCETLPNSVEIPRCLGRRDDGATLLFVGALGYWPNADGILWFAREVLPRLRTRAASCRLLIAGAGAPPKVAALARHPRVTFLGPVADLAALYRRATLAVAPLRAGGGTRIKLLEAAVHRVASVSTPAAARNIDWPRGAGGWLAASPEAFANACVFGLAQAGERDRRAEQALDWVRRHHKRDRVVARLARILAEDTNRPSASAGNPEEP